MKKKPSLKTVIALVTSLLLLTAQTQINVYAENETDGLQPDTNEPSGMNSEETSEGQSADPAVEQPAENTETQQTETEEKQAEENTEEQPAESEVEQTPAEEKQVKTDTPEMTESNNDAEGEKEESVPAQNVESKKAPAMLLAASEEDAVARIGDVYYETLTEAFYDAIDNREETTIELLKESETSFTWSYGIHPDTGEHTYWYNNVTINGNGNKINWGTFRDGAGGVVDYSGGTVYGITVNDAEIVGTTRSGGKNMDFLNRPGSFKFNNCTFNDFEIASNLGYVNYINLANEQLMYEFYDCKLNDCNIFVYNGAHAFIMENCETYDSVFQIWNVQGGESRLTNVTYGKDDGLGCGLLFWDCVNLNIDNLKMTDSLALLIDRTTAVISNSEFTNNTGETVNGYFYHSGSSYTGSHAVIGFRSPHLNEESLTIKNTKMTNNGTSDSSVPMVIFAGYANEVTLENVTITNNTSRQGGVYIEHPETTTIKDSEISENVMNGNYSFGSAGVNIYHAQNTTEIENTNFNNNTNESGYANGTALNYYNGSGIGDRLITVTDCVLTGNVNKSTGNGGAINYFNSGEMVIDKCVINDNSTEKNGGAISFGVGPEKLTIKNTEINNNQAGIDGGGIYHDRIASSLVIQDSEVKSNTAGRNGGGIKMNPPVLSSFASCTVNIDGTEITDNNAVNGGGIYGRVSSAEGAVIKYNIATENGGGINANYEAVLTGAEIYNNAAAVGDDIAIDGGNQVRPLILPQTGEDWALETETPDGETINDCADLIDGWYGDGNWTDYYGGNRQYKLWDVHNDPTSALKFTRAVETEIDTPGYPLALKAAHGLVLNVEKEIESDHEIDTEKEFTFTVSLPDSARFYTGLNVDPEDTVTADNVTLSEGNEVTFKLRHGENMLIYGLSYNDSYTVKEENTEGYVNTVPGKDVSGTAAEYAASVKYINKPLDIYTDLAVSESGKEDYDTEHTAKYDVTGMNSVDVQLEIDISSYQEILSKAAASYDSETIKKELIEEIKKYYKAEYPSFTPSNMDELIEATFTDVDFDVPFESEETFTITITFNTDLVLPADASSYELDTDVFDMAVSGNKVVLTLKNKSEETANAGFAPNSLFANSLRRNPLSDRVLLALEGDDETEDIPAVVVLTIKNVDVSGITGNKDYSISAETEVTGGTLAKTVSLPAFPGRQVPPYPATEKTFTVTVPDSVAVQNLESETYGDGTDFVLVGHNEDGITQLTIESVVVEVKVSKVDDKDKAVSGAQLAVKDSSGKIVDQWTTDGTVHTVKGLLPDNTYTLTEVKAPAGYEKAADITFSTGSDTRVQTLKMVDKKVVVPDTGDTNNTAGWTAGMISAMLIAVAAFLARRKYSTN